MQNFIKKKLILYKNVLSHYYEFVYDMKLFVKHLIVLLLSFQKNKNEPILYHLVKIIFSPEKKFTCMNDTNFELQYYEKILYD